MTPTDEEYYDRLVRSTSSATHAFKTASQVRLNRNGAHDVNSIIVRPRKIGTAMCDTERSILWLALN